MNGFDLTLEGAGQVRLDLVRMNIDPAAPVTMIVDTDTAVVLLLDTGTGVVEVTLEAGTTHRELLL